MWHNFHGQYNGSIVNITHDDLNLVDAKVKLLSGKITVAQNSTAVLGTSTKFNSELEVGSVLYTEGDEVVGVVKSIASDTKLTLVDGSALTLNTVSFKSVDSVMVFHLHQLLVLIQYQTLICTVMLLRSVLPH